MTSSHPGMRNRAQNVPKLMFMGTSVGMVRATICPPASEALVPAVSWCSIWAAWRESTVRTFQLRGRRAVDVMATIRSISSSENESRQPLVMYSRVVPGWSRTTSQKASISRRSAEREVMGRPSPSECVRDWEDEKPSPPASRDSASRRDISAISSSVATSSARSAPMTQRRTAQWPTRKPAFTPRLPSSRSRYWAKLVQSHSTPFSRATRGMPSTLAIIRRM